MENSNPIVAKDSIRNAYRRCSLSDVEHFSSDGSVISLFCAEFSLKELTTAQREWVVF